MGGPEETGVGRRKNMEEEDKVESEGAVGCAGRQ
jgi:hypothetical protein